MSLTPKYGYFAKNSALFDKVNSAAAEASSGGTFPAGGGIYDQSREHTATGDYDYLGPTELLLPLQEVTIVVGYKKTDGTNRVSVAFGSRDHGGAGDVASRCSSHLPYSDGTVYWDFGGDSGANRVSAGGLTFGEDVWVFTTGPRGQEIWQNGTRKAFASGQNPTRTDAPYDSVALGKLPGIASDLALYRFFYIYHRQLSEAEIASITSDPFSWTYDHFADMPLSIDGSETPSLSLELPLPIDGSETPTFALEVPLPIDSGFVEIEWSIPVVVDGDGEDPAVTSAIFDVFREVNSPAFAFFDILAGARMLAGLTPIVAEFDVYEMRTSITAHFEVVPLALVKARKKTVDVYGATVFDPKIQQPIADVEVT